MAKYLIMSDLHFEFHQDAGNSFIDSLREDVDGIILAGDIYTRGNMKFVVEKFCNKYKHVICVDGNHSFYGYNRNQIQADTYDLVKKFPNFHYLDNDVLELGGQRFLGTPLWFSNPIIFDKHIIRDWSDFQQIKGFSGWVYKENTKAKNFLNDEMQEDDIVITHYLPSTQCVVPQYMGNPTNIFFVCDVEHLIVEKKPKLWVSGHTHVSFDFNIENTKMLCNPFGYARFAENIDFDENLIIEV